jgi:nifR3 family TIM-barrel protein
VLGIEVPVLTTERASDAAPLTLSDRVVVPVPVVLAPMAGITNAAFRTLCRRQGPDGLYISEMITSRALLERNAKTMRLIRFGPDERPRSLQLYGVDPVVVEAAVRMVVAEGLADHVDLNFGCPVPKVTRKGGGAALPWHIDLFADIVSRAVRAAGGAIAVSVKMRLGIDREHLTYREAALRAQDAGVAYVALHGRTAADFYGGQAAWGPIAELAELLDIPVLGNGDIWEADDAVRMMAGTGCAGVVIGRGCLGRPWLFADLAAAFAGRPDRARPSLAQVSVVMREHAELLARWLGEQSGVVDFRKHVAWYLKGFSAPGPLRLALASASSLSELDGLLGQLDLAQPYPESVVGQPRGRTTGTRPVALPAGWLNECTSRAVPYDAELAHSGG